MGSSGHSRTNAILYALTSPHSSRSDADFNAWYDTKHAPSRAACPGVHHVSRFVANDDKKPNWLATYELQDESALRSPEYKKARENDGDDESVMFSDLSRRVYKLLSDKKMDGYTEYCNSEETGGRRSMIHVALQPAKEQKGGNDLTDDEFNKWYEEEHVPLLSKCPGWLRSTRWQLIDEMDPRTGEKHTDQVAKFLACHEWQDGDAVYQSEEFKYAVMTPWRNRVMNRVDPKTEERRLFRLWKHFLPDGQGSVAGEQGAASGVRSWDDIAAVPKKEQ